MSKVEGNVFAREYRTENFLTPIISAYGQISLDILKRYLLGAVFTYFDNPLYVSSPIVQDNLTKSPEVIFLSSKESLRHTFHHFYFKELQHKDLSNFSFPLEFIEQGIHFRKEGKEKLHLLSRQSAFTVTNLHSFCDSKSQAIGEIKRVFACAKSFERNLGIKYEILSHMKGSNLIASKVLEDLWEEKFEYDTKSEEEAPISLDFNFKDKSGDVHEITSLEIYPIVVGNLKNCLLVDFTIGGAERMLSSIYSSSQSLPLWLTPVQIVAYRKALGDKDVERLGKFRTIFAYDRSQQKFYQKHLIIPFSIDNEEQISIAEDSLTKSIPAELGQPLFKPQHLSKGGLSNLDIM